MDIRAFFGGKSAQKIEKEKPSSPDEKSIAIKNQQVKMDNKTPPNTASPIAHKPTAQKRDKLPDDGLVDSDDDDGDGDHHKVNKSSQANRRKKLKKATDVDKDGDDDVVFTSSLTTTHGTSNNDMNNKKSPPLATLKNKMSSSSSSNSASGGDVTDQESQSQSQQQNSLIDFLLDKSSPTLSTTTSSTTTLAVPTEAPSTMNFEKFEFQSPMLQAKPTPKQRTSSFSSNNNNAALSGLPVLLPTLKPLNSSAAAVVKPTEKLVSIAGGASAFFGSSSSNSATSDDKGSSKVDHHRHHIMDVDLTEEIDDNNKDNDLDVVEEITPSSIAKKQKKGEKDVVVVDIASPPPVGSTATRTTRSATTSPELLKSSSSLSPYLTLTHSLAGMKYKSKVTTAPPAKLVVTSPTKLGTTTTTTTTTATRPAYHYNPHVHSAGPLLQCDGDNEELFPKKREAPTGRPGCLENMKIAVTGVFDSFSREQMEDFVLKYGGKVANNVSGKTDYLLIGTRLEDGRAVSVGSKYRTAEEKHVNMLTETMFLDMIQASNPSGDIIDWSLPTSSSPAAAAVPQSNIQLRNSSSSSNFKPTTTASTTIPSATTSQLARPKYLSSSSSSSSSSSNSNNNTSTTNKTDKTKDDTDSLWVDKYKPGSTAEIIGSADTAKKLTDWLRSWHKIHVEKSVKMPFNKENPGAKAVLLSGPPGIGKTTLATLIAAELGYETLELNASDTRSKKAITEELSDVVLSQAISSHTGKVHKRCVIMDEVDGMGGSDRGGIPELIKVIKTSKNPIICICNDRQSIKIRSLANHCYDLRVRRPTKQQVATRMVSIASKEGLQMDQNAAESLVEQSGNDIRQVINCLQMWRSQSQVLRYDDIKNRMSSIEKDKILRQSPFDACLSILGGQKYSFDERYNSFFIDYSLVPLLVQQNYIEAGKNGLFRPGGSSNNGGSGGSDVYALEQLAKAAEAVSDMDLTESAIRGQDQHWELLTTQAAFAMKVGHHVNGFLGGYPSFPAWLGKNSTCNKNKRLVHELVHHTSLTIAQGFTALRLEYTPYLRSMLLKTLQQPSSSSTTNNTTSNTTTTTNNNDNNNTSSSSSTGVERVIELLDRYGLSREDFMETFKELQLVYEKDPQLRDQYDAIDSKTKSALTRLYNTMEHRSQALASTLAGAKKTGGAAGKKGSSSRYDDEDEDEYGMDEEDKAALKDEDNNNNEDDNDIGDVSAFVKKHKASSSKSKATNSSCKSSKASSSATATKGKGKGTTAAAAKKK